MRVNTQIKHHQVINHQQKNNKKKSIKIISSNLYPDKKEETTDLKTHKIKANSSINQILIRLEIKVQPGL
jgi:hypothetical protein